MWTVSSPNGAPKKKWKTKPRILAVLGFTLVGLGVLILIHWPHFFDSMVDHELILSETSTSFKVWKDIPIPIYMEFYFFNWSNPDDLGRAGTKPIFKEVGPYVYRETRKKIVDAWNPLNGTVTFRQNRTWHFEPSMSVGSDSDVITTVNIVGAIAQYACSHLDLFTKIIVDSAIQGTDPKIFVQPTVHQLIFEGYDDRMLRLVSILPPGMFPINIPMLKFAFFYGRNGSADYDGMFNMRTGMGDLDHIGELAQLDYKNKTDIFKSHCGAINGSAGELFAVRNGINKSLDVFSGEFCRSFTLPFENVTKVDGIPAYRYTARNDILADGRIDPNNWCFCTSNDRSQCPLSGVMELSACKWGAAILLSLPHFYQAHPSYHDAVIGMRPDGFEHQTFVEVHPKLGVPLRGNAAFQINVFIEELEGFSLFERVPRTYFPVMWFKQSLRIDAHHGFLIKCLTIYLPHAINGISYIFIVMGLLFVLYALLFIVVRSPAKANVSIVYSAVPDLHPL